MENAAHSVPVATQEALPEQLVLLRRLLDVVGIPASRVGAQDRAIAGDLLLELLIDADVESLSFCSQRLQNMSEVPRRVLRFLAGGPENVSKVLLEDNTGIDQSDLYEIARTGENFHRMAIASRRDIGPCISDAIADSGDIDAMERLLQNRLAEISEHATDRMVNASHSHPKLTPLLLARPEIRPAQALVMFWWSEATTRRDILMRFSAERMVLIKACSDIFVQARDEGWTNPMVQKALQLIERRQRNRHALERSPFSSLEHAVAAAKDEGMSREMVEEISCLAGIQPLTGAKIMSDKGGEGVAILCKATGLKRPYFASVWSALRRNTGDAGNLDPDFARVLEIYDMMAVAKAQTVLRYWNWSLSAAFSPDVLEMQSTDAPRLGDGGFRPTSRAARLVFGR